MRKFRFFVCLFLALSLGAAAWPADKAAKRLYLPCCIFEGGIPSPDTPTVKLSLWLSLPVKVLHLDYPAFVAKKDKTPAEKFLAELFAAVADGTAVDKYLAGKADAAPMLHSGLERERLAQGFHLEYLARFDGEYLLLFRVDALEWYGFVSFRQGKDGKWELVDNLRMFGSLVTELWAAAVRRGESEALFAKPDAKYTTGVNFDEKQWDADVTTPDSEFQVHFNARPLNFHFERYGAPAKPDAFSAALYAFYQAKGKHYRYGDPALAVDMGAQTWVIYNDIDAIYKGFRPWLRSVWFAKQEDGAWKPCPEDNYFTRRPFELMAINVLNAARPMVK